MMGAAWMLARVELRRHRLRLAALTVLVALVGGVVIASALGAERSRTSLDRFIAATNAADAAVFAEDPDQFDELGRLDGVASVSPFTLLAVMPEVLVGNDEVFLPMIASHDGRIPYELNGVRVIDGVLPAPDDPDRIALHEATADLLGVRVGDSLPMVGFSPDDIEEIFSSGGDVTAPGGPTFDLEIAALIRDPLDVVNRADDIVMTPVTPALTDRYRDEVGSLGEGAFVELTEGTDVESFTAEVRAQGLEMEVERWVGADSIRDTGFGPALDLLGDGLLLFAMVVAVAGGLVVGQALSRNAAAAREETTSLSALGFGRRQRLVALSIPGVMVAVAGAAASAPVAFVLSGFFPVGIARRAEPDPGVQFEAWIIAGVASVVVLVASAAITTSYLSMRRPRPQAAEVRPSARWIRAWVPTTLGRAISSGGGSTVRSTRAAVLVGGVGVAAALVFATSLDRLLSTPEHYGWSFDTTVNAGNFDAVQVNDGVDVATDPAVAEVAEAVFQIEMDVDGSPLYGYAIGDGTGAIAPVVSAGEVPRSADQVAVGRESLRRLGKAVGDEVEITAGGSTHTFEIVGQAIVPVSSDGGRVGNGVTMSLSAAAQLGIDPASSCEEDASCYRQTAVKWRDGADIAAARERLLAGTAEFDVPTPPAEVERLDEVESIPWVLAGLLAMLAAAATVHAIVVTVSRRRRDLAILRALGSTPNETRWAVTSQAAAIVTIAAIVGTAGGVAVGRLLWRSVAGSVGVVAVPAVPMAAVLGLPIAIVALALVASLTPAHQAARLRPAEILRAE